MEEVERDKEEEEVVEKRVNGNEERGGRGKSRWRRRGEMRKWR